jgi:hypothetical protein
MSDDISAPDRYAAWITSAIAPVMRRHGFSRRRHTFDRHGAEGWGHVAFQASQFGDRNETRFTVELASTIDGRSMLEGVDPATPPRWYRGHWRQRLASAVLGETDRWWAIDATTDLERLTAEVVPLLERAITIVERRMTAAGIAEAAGATPRLGMVRACRGGRPREQA